MKYKYIRFLALHTFDKFYDGLWNKMNEVIGPASNYLYIRLHFLENELNLFTQELKYYCWVAYVLSIFIFCCFALCKLLFIRSFQC